MIYAVSQLAALLGREYIGDGACIVEKVSSWDASEPGSLVYWDGEKEEKLSSRSLQAACIIAPKDPAMKGLQVICSPQPKLDFAKAAAWLHPQPKSLGTCHATVEIGSGAVIGSNVEIGPFAAIEADACIGENTIIRAGVVVGSGCVIGKECILHPGVVLYPGVQLGNRVVLHAGVVIGSDGFGYVPDGERLWKFPQAGRVIIEDDVEIGANTTIDRGSLGMTRIGNGSKIDNLVQIAHNVVIGKHVVIASQTGISGSTIIEDFAVIGGQVGFGDHAYVQRGAVIGSKAGVLPGKIVRSGDVYWGVPVRPLREYKRLNALFGRLPEMKAEIDMLKKEVALLKSQMPE
jgi:UDP-3-O-[3-hydroxymyristoyl] glucosamine N-acyltransferase